MSFPFDVIVCGSLHLDIVVLSSALPRIDETATGTSWHMACGGKGSNQAVAAARQGLRTAMIGRIGKDDFGRRLLANLDEAGVNTQCISVDDTAESGMSVALQIPGGDYGAAIVSGSNLRLSPELAIAEWARLGGAAALILQNEIPDDTNAAIAAHARANGAKVILNAAPMREMSSALLDNIDVVILNRVEAEAFLSIDSATQEKVASALDAQASHISIVVTMGGSGVLVKAPDQPTVYIEPIRVAVVSSHGAGDCFTGAFTSALVQRKSLIDAVHNANETAAKHVSRARHN